MAHEFLSEEWIQAAGALREQASDVEPVVAHQLKINLVVTDSPLEASEFPAHVDTTSGHVVIDRGHLPEADLEIRVDYQTAKSILVDKDSQVALNSFMEGRIVITGDMTKLMALQATPADPRAIELVDAIREMTA